MIERGLVRCVPGFEGSGRETNLPLGAVCGANCTFVDQVANEALPVPGDSNIAAFLIWTLLGAPHQFDRACDCALKIGTSPVANFHCVFVEILF